MNSSIAASDFSRAPYDAPELDVVLAGNVEKTGVDPVGQNHARLHQFVEHRNERLTLLDEGGLAAGRHLERGNGNE